MAALLLCGGIPVTRGRISGKEQRKKRIQICYYRPPNTNGSFKRKTWFQEVRDVDRQCLWWLGHSQELQSLVWRYFYLKLWKSVQEALLGNRSGVMRDPRRRRRRRVKGTKNYLIAGLSWRKTKPWTSKLEPNPLQVNFCFLKSWSGP